ncbi:MAG: efflux RND transporter permease subunit [Bacteroidales bacterium]|nr:efflux RND transporter permease subunit [Bacteroidales bacterium]
MGNFEGLRAGEYRDGSFEYDIRVRGDMASRDKISDVADYVIPLPAGGMVRLPDVAVIEYTAGPSQLFRRDRQGQVSVTCDVAPGVSQGELAASIEEQVKQVINKYPECSYAFSGEVEMMNESFMRMGIALIMAICLTFMLIASLLESIGQAIIIMFALPLSMIGVFIGLYLTGQTFSIFSIMSVIMLVGLVVNNSIVVLDHSNHLQKEKDMDRDQSLIESGRTRLRPILMANITTIIALIPLALGLGWGGEMRQSMAIVQIGGLVTGGMLGLLVVPSIYSLTSDIVLFITGNRKRKAA